LDHNTCEQRDGGPAISSLDHRIVFTGIPVDDLGKAWGKAKAHLIRALAPNETIDQLLTAIYQKKMQLWVAYEGPDMQAAMTTEIFFEGPRKICNLCHLGGSGINNWLDYLGTVKAWAKADGCDAIRVSRGRPGWKRLLKDFTVTHVILEKEL
jgi:hypothetical protein